MREGQEEFPVSVNTAAVGALTLQTEKPVTSWFVTVWAWNVRPYSRIWCCSAPCRFPEAFNLAGAFTDQPDRQPAVRLRLHVPQVGVCHHAIVTWAEWVGLHRVWSPQQSKNTPLVFPQSFSCVMESPWLLWISLIPERVAGLLTQTRRFLKTWNSSSQLFGSVLLKCAIKYVLFCQNCFALIPAPSQGSESCTQIQWTVRHPVGPSLFLVFWQMADCAENNS